MALDVIVDPSGTEEAPDQPSGVEAAQAEPTRAVRRRRTSQRRRVIAIVLLLVVLVIVAPVAWFLFEAYPIGGSGAPAMFEVTAGESIAQVVDAMAQKGIVGSSLAFRIDLMVTGTPSAQPGWYVLPTSSSFSAARNLLVNGPNAHALGTYTGQTNLEIAQALSSIAGGTFASRFLDLARAGSVPSPYQRAPGTSLEGLVAPGLFVITKGETPRDLLTQMVRKFDRRAAAAGITPSTSVNGLDAYEILTVASIVEKEGYLPLNMPKTATVIYNRLARGMPLQMDSTVLYATGQDGGTVTHATEQFPSPYNTYLHTGLTPTPICIPSIEALAAALNPPPGPWLYFTLIDKTSGAMAFAKTFAEQLTNEQLFAERYG